MRLVSYGVCGPIHNLQAGGRRFETCTAHQEPFKVQRLVAHRMTRQAQRHCLAVSVSRRWPHRRQNPYLGKWGYRWQKRKLASEQNHRRSDPPELFHGPSCMPDLRHVPDLLAVELHHVYIVRLEALAGRWAGTTRSGMSAGEDSVSTDVLPFVIGGERLHLVSPVENGRQQPLHPFCVLLQGPCVRERFGLRGERRIRVAVLLASLPSFPGFAGFEEFSGNFRDRCHGPDSFPELQMLFNQSLSLPADDPLPTNQASLEGHSLGSL